MSFFYDLNKRLATLATKQEQEVIAESKKAEAVAQSPLTQALNESDYSAKKARAGKDIGKPGKAFAKIAKSAGERYGSKAAGERVAGAVLNKLRHPKEDIENEGNAFTGALAKTPKGGKFKVGNKEFTDTSSLEEGDNPGLEEGYAEMDAWLKSREKEKGTGRFDKRKVSTGTVYTRKPETFDEPEGDEEVSDKPKKKGRPAGSKRAIGAKVKGTSKLHRQAAIAECDPGEYDEEGDMAKDNLETMVLAAKELHSILGDNDNLPEWVQAKITKALDYINTANDYIHSEKRDMHDEVAEVAPPGAKAERMVKHIKKAYSKDGKLTPKEKSIAYATAWKAHNKGKVEEEGTKPDFLDVDKDGNKKESFKKAVADKEDNKAERAGKKVTKDIEYDEGHKAKGDNKAEKAGKKVTKDIEYDDKKDKEEKVDETTTSGSVATASAAPKSSKGMQFGKGVYESMNSKVENMISEGMNVSVNMNSDAEGDAQKSVTVTATGADADKLAELLKMAGIEHKQATCEVCGEANCQCQELDENSPDWPTNDETLSADPELRTYSGGLNGPKSTGQTTVPVIASQLRRQASMEESVELERTLFKTWKNYKG